MTSKINIVQGIMACIITDCIYCLICGELQNVTNIGIEYYGNIKDKMTGNTKEYEL